MQQNRENIKARIAELEKQLQENSHDPAEVARAAKEYSALRPTFDLITETEKLDAQIKETELLAGTEENQDMKDLADFELTELAARHDTITAKLEEALAPKDPRDEKPVILEIRAGTGGDEAALFAADLYRMYSHYAERKGWKMKVLDENRIGIGGFKEIIAEVAGQNVYGHLKFEQGVHRVQRVPETEKQGRIHTSTATVAVMPEVEEIDFKLDPKDLRIDIYHAGGKGGQNVNKVATAVRVTHIPTGIIASCQNERFQQQNKEKALMILRARLIEAEEAKRAAREKAERREQIGGGERSEKIRTYNYPQDRITDHRIKENWSGMDRILDGDLDEIISALKKAARG